MKKKHFINLILLFILALSACQVETQPSTQESQPLVTVSILPQAYFVERISNGLVAVNVMVGPGEEAHTYEPTPEQMKALTNSDVFFSIGVEYEDAWIPRFRDVNPKMLVVDSTAGIERLPMSSSHINGDLNAETEKSHDGGRPDPHVWLSPPNGKLIAANILATLSNLIPEHESDFQKNFDLLAADIDTLNAQIEETLSGLENRSFMVFHPAWGYFADEYNLVQIPVQIGGQDPNVRELATLVDIAREQNIQVIFIQPTFNAADAKAIAEEIGAEVAIVDPLAKEWLENLKIAADAFAAALHP